LHQGFKFTLTHASSGSLKTDAPPEVIFDIIRCWVKKNPVKEAKEGDPARVVLSKEPKFEADFTLRDDAEPPSAKQKIVRYQANPTANWGPKVL
jgi:tRNA (guanine26-N2/guanine27-N2)-dimethyltransferase